MFTPVEWLERVNAIARKISEYTALTVNAEDPMVAAIYARKLNIYIQILGDMG